jgi:hypothetical protein
MRPVTPTPQDSTLAAVVQYAQQVAPELADRLARAQALVQAGAVTRGEYSDRVWWVRSQSQARRAYAVVAREHGAWVCSCPDHQRRGNWCKHGLAAALVRRLASGRGPSAPAPIPFPRPTLDPDAPIPYALTARAYRLLDGEPQPAA